LFELSLSSISPSAFPLATLCGPIAPFFRIEHQYAVLCRVHEQDERRGRHVAPDGFDRGQDVDDGDDNDDDDPFSACPLSNRRHRAASPPPRAACPARLLPRRPPPNGQQEESVPPLPAPECGSPLPRRVAARGRRGHRRRRGRQDLGGPATRDRAPRFLSQEVQDAEPGAVATAMGPIPRLLLQVDSLYLQSILVRGDDKHVLTQDSNNSNKSQ